MNHLVTECILVHIKSVYTLKTIKNAPKRLLFFYILLIKQINNLFPKYILNLDNMFQIVQQIIQITGSGVNDNYIIITNKCRTKFQTRFIFIGY